MQAKRKHLFFCVLKLQKQRRDYFATISMVAVSFKIQAIERRVRNKKICDETFKYSHNKVVEFANDQNSQNSQIGY